jgi:hypothetical protein
MEMYAQALSQDIERMPMCLVQKLIECGTPGLGPAHPVVHAFADDSIAALICELTKFDPLRFQVLITVETRMYSAAHPFSD